MSFPAYENYKESGIEWLGQVPSSWQVALAKRFLTVKSGDMISASEEVEIGHPIIGGNGLRGYTDKTNSRGDTLVIGRVGALCGCVHHITEDFWASEHAYRVVEKCPLDKRFLFHLLTSINLNRFAIKTAQPLLNTDIVEMQWLAMPPLGEQRAIAAFLDRETAKIDALVEAQERLIALLKEKRQAVISHAVTKGLDPSAPMKDSGVEWLGQVPAHWEVKPARHVFVERDERSPSGEETLLTVSHLTGVTPRSEKSVNMFEAETTEGYKQCYAGDLVINTLWAWMGAMGIARQAGIVSPAYNVYTPRANYEAAYVNAVVRMPAFAREAERFSKGVWSSRLRLYPAEFFQIALPIPPVDEQVAIAKSLERYSVEYGALAGEAEAAITLLQERRAALISAAVTGKIDVRGLVQTAEAA